MAEGLGTNTPDNYHYQDDEISLVDLWLTLVKRKSLVLGITAFALAAGTALAFLKPPQYEYRTSIEIGSRIMADKSVAIEQPTNTLAKIQESYIPAVLLAHGRANEGDVLEIKARTPKNSEIVILTAKGTEEEGGTFTTLLNEIIERLKNDHQRIISTLKAELDIRRRNLENQLASLDDQAELIEADKVRLKERAELIKAQIADLQRLVESTEAQYKRAVAKPGNEANAMTLLLLDSEVRATRSKLADLQEKLQIVLARDADQLAKQTADILRKQSEIKDQIAKVELEMTNFHETRAVVQPMQSLEPVGVGKKAILALALFGGLFMGVFAAFIADFLAKAKEQLATTQNAGVEP